MKVWGIAIAFVVGCASDRPPIADTSVPDASSGPQREAGVADAGAGGDADASRPVDELCLTHPQEGPIVERTRQTGSPPVPTGGTVAPGKYFLTASNVYTSSPIALVTRTAETLVVTTDDLAFAFENDGDATVYRSRSSFTTNGTQLTTTLLCFAPQSDAGPGPSMRTFGYSATTNELRLYGGGAGVLDELVYTKQ